MSAQKPTRLSSRLRRDSILFEDNHLLAAIKPAGLLTAGDRTGDVTLFALAQKYLKEKYNKPGNVYLGLVHRLDRPVSGVILFARTSKAAGRLSEQFRKGSVEKVYHAWVQGRPDTASGRLVDHLLKDRERNVVRAVRETTAGAQSAALTYRVLRKSGERSLLEIKLETGRSHQIRVQLASRGWPIVGDVKYGGPALGGNIALHAAELACDHPTTRERITLRASDPPEWNTF